MADKNWIAGAINPKNRGKFKAAAQRAGMSTRAYAEAHKGDSGTLGNRARLALNLMGLGKKKKSGS